MARVRFLAKFNYRPSGAPRTVISYLADREYTVKRECAEQAVAEGKGVEMPFAPSRAFLAAVEAPPPRKRAARTGGRSAKVRHADA